MTSSLTYVVAEKRAVKTTIVLNHLSRPCTDQRLLILELITSQIILKLDQISMTARCLVHLTPFLRVFHSQANIGISWSSSAGKFVKYNTKISFCRISWHFQAKIERIWRWLVIENLWRYLTVGHLVCLWPESWLPDM